MTENGCCIQESIESQIIKVKGGKNHNKTSRVSS